MVAICMKHILCIFMTCILVTKCRKVELSSSQQFENTIQYGGQLKVDDGDLMTKILQKLEYLEARETKYEENMEAMQSTISRQNRRIASLEGTLKDIDSANNNLGSQSSLYHFGKGNITQGYRFDQNHVGVSRTGKSRERRQQVKACAFYASIYNHHLQQLGANQDIPFDKVYTNVGNAYHPNLGVFIAPQPGTYVFSTTIMDVNSHDSRYYFSVNGQAQGNLFIHGVNSYLSSSSRTAIFLLKAGDEVAVKNAHVNEGVYGYEYSSFSGFLVSFDDSAGVVVG